MAEIPGSGTVSTKLRRIAELARESPQTSFNSIHHVIDIEFLEEAFRRTRKDGAAGIDGQTADEYAIDLGANLASLLERFRSGSYVAPPVRRVHIPKGDGSKTRPIGIPTFEDKLLQRAVAMVLEAIYEQDFRDCSYGFRPGRSAHQALETFRNRMMERHGGWVIEVDIQSFFDTLDHGHLRRFLDQRVRDGVLRRMIDKWLKAGILEEGVVTHPHLGTPQGGVISPLLANIYLHEVLDRWFQDRVRFHLEGWGSLVRYADDVVIACERESEARWLMELLPKRFAKYGLTLNPEKTRLVPFGRPSRRSGSAGSGTTPPSGSFDLLGFTHSWRRSRRGYWVIRQTTAKSRFTRTLKRIREFCRRHRHDPVREQWEGLTQKLRGHYAFFGITGNGGALTRLRYGVLRIWEQWLGRRSQHHDRPWDWFSAVLSRYPLPMPVVVHSISRPQRNRGPRSRMW